MLEIKDLRDLKDLMIHVAERGMNSSAVLKICTCSHVQHLDLERERVFNYQPAGPDPLYHPDDLVDRPRAMRV